MSIYRTSTLCWRAKTGENSDFEKKEVLTENFSAGTESTRT